MMNLRAAGHFLLLGLLSTATALFFGIRAQAQLPPPLTLDSGWQLQDVARATDAPEQISTVGYKPSRWFKATVPGTVLTSLVNDGVYPEPLYGENNRPDKIPESLCRTAYWYRTTVKIPTSFKSRHVWLNFNGINYRAEVWVNGHRAGDIAGAFARGVFDVTAAVHVGASNAVAVKILPPPHPGNPLEQTIARGTGPNGGITALDGPTFLSTIGWDWIPGIRDRDMGIWQNVTLTATGPVTINDLNVVTNLPLPRTDSADLFIEATLRNLTDQPQPGILVGKFGDTPFLSSVTLAPNETRVVALSPSTIDELHLRNPRLWWPNGYGQPNLYHLRLAFVSRLGEPESDARELNFGVRKITYSVPGSENLTLSVNGVPVLCKGGDWGMDEAMKRIPRARLDAQVRMHRDANFTMIRNWVGQSTSEDFYDACDKYGILLWDEMFQPNPSDGPNADDLPLYLANVREKILRFRSHPSIAVWCARNEGLPPPNIDAGIQALMAELEHSGRLYQRSSTEGRGVHSGGPYFWRAPRDFYNVDAPFKTEIGTVSIPTLESIQSMMPAKDWNVINDDWAEHDLLSGAQAGDRFPVQMTDRYGPISNLADFARKGQMASYEAFRAMFEGRNSKLFQPATGVLTWMSNPSQPSFVWQIYSWDLEPCAALYASKLACEPVHVQMNESTEKNGHIEVINNTPAALTGLTVKTTVLNLDGKIAYTQTTPATAAASAATDLGAIAFPANVSQVHFVKLTLNDATGRQLSQNFYWRATPDAPDNLQALNTLPNVTLEATAAEPPPPFETIPLLPGQVRPSAEITLHNPSSVPALMVHLQLRSGKSMKRILAASYDDNYFSLLPGETRTIRCYRDVSNFRDPREPQVAGTDALLITIDGWNIAVQDASTSKGQRYVSVVTNPDVKIPAASPVAPAPNNGTRPFALAIDCGGEGVSSGFFTFGAPPPPNSFLRDRNFRGGNQSGGGEAILVKGVAHAAPEAVYQSERWGACTYNLRVPQPAAGHSYTVRLHFADTTYDAKGARRFNVAINGVPRLTDFDIVAEAGGKDRALVKEFAGIAPDAKGNIAIDLTRGTVDEPEIRGIEIVAAPSAPTTPTVTVVPVAPQPVLVFDNPTWGLGTFVKADAANPVLSPLPTTFPNPMNEGKPVAWEHDHTFNPAAVVRDGKICVLYRAEDDSGQGIGGHTSRLGLAESVDGLHFTRRPAPVFYPDKDAQQGNEWSGGCEDPRLVETDDHRYVLTYTQWNRKVARLAVATSTDLIHWDKHGPAFASAYDGRFRDLFCKSGAIVTSRQGDHLVATRIGGKYWMLWGEGSIHAATSDDLVTWTPTLDDKNELLAIFTTRKGKFDSDLVEGGPPAVLTDKGIVMLYNGKNAGGASGDTSIGGGAYSGGMALLDKNDPTKVLERTDSFFFTPERDYEKTGQYAAGTTFIEGLVPFKGQWFLYYGTADSFVAVATAKMTH